jgi:thioredoxin reductase
MKAKRAKARNVKEPRACAWVSIKRLLQSVLVLLVLTFLVFLVIHLLPGDPLLLYTGQSNAATLSTEQLHSLRAEYGLDKPLLVQYFVWIYNVLHGDMGKSIFYNDKVSTLIIQRMPVTIHLGLTAILIGAIVGITFGVICALRRGKWIDSLLTFIANIGITAPGFWVGILMIYLFPSSCIGCLPMAIPRPFRISGKKVMVIGGGPAGMEAARTLAERGHETSLYEKSDKLGGQWKLVSINYLSTGMRKAGVKVFLNREVTAAMVEEMKPDVAVVATGSDPVPLHVPGADGKNVVQATGVLAGNIELGNEVVIIGGRLVGLTTALFLAEQGKKVSVITRNKIARGLMHNTKMVFHEYLLKNNVRLFPNCTPESITENGVNCWWDSGEPPEKDNIFFFLKADNVVLAVGAVNNYRLGDLITGIVPETYKIGDCSGKRSVFAAMREGSEIARKI